MVAANQSSFVKKFSIWKKSLLAGIENGEEPLKKNTLYFDCMYIVWVVNYDFHEWEVLFEPLLTNTLFCRALVQKGPKTPNGTKIRGSFWPWEQNLDKNRFLSLWRWVHWVHHPWKRREEGHFLFTISALMEGKQDHLRIKVAPDLRSTDRFR